MKKKNFGLGTLAILLLLTAFLTSCIFSSDDDGLTSFISDKGLPSNYKMETLSINNLKIASAEAALDTSAKSANGRAVLGSSANISHDLVFDLAFSAGSSFLDSLKKSDSTGAYLIMFWLRTFYSDKNFPAGVLPLEEEFSVNVSWKLDLGNGKPFLDSLTKEQDSSWYKSLSNWENTKSADTTFKIKLAKGDTSIRLDLPSALVESIKAIEKSAHLQLKLSTPEAKNIYRFYGDSSNFTPVFVTYASEEDFMAVTPYRMANIPVNKEECKECPVLHGGVFDSLIVEIPPEPIMKALADFYGDEFPYTKGDKFDVRQTVILAELTMYRDDSKGNSELGNPIQVVVGSFVDSADVTVRRMENYRLNKELILTEGHQNLIFHEGDSLTLQITEGVKDFLNKASDGRSLKFMMRVGYPFLQEKDTSYTDYRTDKGDTVRLFMKHFDYARYDFTKSMESPMTLKLWLASKRGDK